MYVKASPSYIHTGAIHTLRRRTTSAKVFFLPGLKTDTSGGGSLYAHVYAFKQTFRLYLYSRLSRLKVWRARVQGFSRPRGCFATSYGLSAFFGGKISPPRTDFFATSYGLFRHLVRTFDGLRGSKEGSPAGSPGLRVSS